VRRDISVNDPEMMLGIPAGTTAATGMDALTHAVEAYVAKGAHFGPHNLHENRVGSFVSSNVIFATWQNAGVRAFDISDAYQPREIGAFVPAAPIRMIDRRPGRPKVIQSADVFVDAAGLIYATDNNAGLSIIEFAG